MAVWKGRGTTMPKLKNEVPKLAKSGNCACVYYGGKRHRLGIWGSQEAKTAYTRFIAELQASPVTFGVTQQPRGEVLVAELAADFFKSIQERMHPSHIHHFRTTIGNLVEIYGDIPAAKFPLEPLHEGANRGRQFNSNTHRLFHYGDLGGNFYSIPRGKVDGTDPINGEFH